MGLKLAFYSKQAIRSLRNYVYLIIGIGISISLILGMFNYMTSSGSFNLKQSITTLPDFRVNSRLNPNKSQIYQRFGGNETFITEKFLDSNLHVESISHFAEFSSPSIKIQNNAEIRFDFVLFDGHFLESNKFKDYFTLIEGRTPQNNWELMIDAWIAHELNLTITSNISLPYELTVSDDLPKVPCYFSNISIVGIYQPNKEVYSPTGIKDYFCPTPYIPEYSKSEDINFNASSSPFGPIIGYFDYRISNETHPINAYFDAIEKNVSWDYRFITYRYGLGINLNRDLIPPFQLSNYMHNLYFKYSGLRKEILKSQEISITSFIFSELDDFSEDFKLARLSSIALVIPMILFTIGLGNFIILTNFNNRQEEFGRLRIKGYPKGMIIGQITFESIYVGISAFLLSIPLSVAVFYGIQPWINSIFINIPHYHTFIPLRLDFFNFLIGISFALVISILGNILTIIKILRSRIASMNQKQQGVSLEIGYDENIFSETKKDKKQSKFTAYLDQTELFEKSIPKISYYLIAFSLIPFILIFIRYLGLLPNASDALKIYANWMKNINTVMLIFASLSPILLVYGLLRFLIQESPSRFARICKFLSKPFVRHHDYLNGLEMLRRKPYILIIFTVGLFTSSLVFSNINRYSQGTEMKFFENTDAISDISITINSSHSYIYQDFNNQNISFSELNDYTSSLLALNSSEGTPIIDSFAHVSFSTLKPMVYLNNYGYDYLGSCYLVATNLSSYIKTVHPDILQKFPSIENSIKKLQTFRENNQDNETIGIIVNSRFADKFLGDGINSFSGIYALNGINESFSQFTIVDIIDYLPAAPANTFIPEKHWFYSMESEHYETVPSAFVFCDFSDLESNDSYFKSTAFTTLIRTKTPVDAESNFIQTELAPIVEDFSQSIKSLGEKNQIRYEFFDNSWEEKNFNDFGYDPLIVVNLLYLNLIIIGVLLAFAIITTIIGIEKSNTHFEGLLLSRGFGKWSLFKFIFSQISIIFIYSFVVGGISSAVTGWTWMEAYLSTRTHYSWSGANIAALTHLPVTFNPIEIFAIMLLDFILTSVLYLIFFILQERKSISRLLIKF